MGAITVTNLDNRVVGNQRVVVGTGTMSSSYATGGETFPLTAIGLARLDRLEIINSGLGVVCRWNGSQTAPLVQAFRDVTPAANAALAEPAAAQNMAATGIFQFAAYGG